MSEHTIETSSGDVTASTSVLAEATAELINGLRRLSRPDDLQATVDWAMGEWPNG